jgi:hypothetical protein
MWASCLVKATTSTVSSDAIVGDLSWSTCFCVLIGALGGDVGLFNCCAQILELNCYCLAAIFFVILWKCEQAIPSLTLIMVCSFLVLLSVQYGVL